jgi:predicted nucleotidyltransferase component of viral defense system
MTTPLPKPVTADGLFLWIMHRFSETFEQHAVLKGGVALRLVDSPRTTTNIDYVFVPFQSTSDVREDIERVLYELEGAQVSIRLHSTMLRADVRVDAVAIQLEVSVAPECASAATGTGGFARSLGQPSQVVRVMSWAMALAHKLAAWNERRLPRDLYDAYFIAARLGVQPNLQVLDARLAKVRSRLPGMRSRKEMTRAELAAALRGAAAGIDEASIEAELAPLLKETELAGLPIRMRAAATGLADGLELA